MFARNALAANTRAASAARPWLNSARGERRAAPPPPPCFPSGLPAVAYKGLSDIDAGKCVDFNLRTWFIHAHSLAERVKDIISKTATVHLTSKAEEDSITQQFQLYVKGSVLDRIEDTRNEFAHGGRRSWARGLTEEDLGNHL